MFFCTRCRPANLMYTLAAPAAVYGSQQPQVRWQGRDCRQHLMPWVQDTSAAAAAAAGAICKQCSAAEGLPEQLSRPARRFDVGSTAQIVNFHPR